MICKACNFENKEGTAFCTNCGKPLGTENVSPMEPVKGDERTTMLDPAMQENKDDDSESNTTVLTNNMVNAPGQPAPGFGAAPKPMTPNGMPVNGMPMNGMPMNGAPMNGAPMNGAPMNGMPKPGAPMNGMPMNGAPVNNAPKAQKAPKAPKTPKAPKAKKSKGTVAYIVISIILILGLIGTGVWGYFHFNGKLDDADKEKDALEAELTDQFNAELAQKDADYSMAVAEAANLQTEIDELNSKIESMQTSADEYSKYDSLISYLASNGIQGTSAFFASSNVVYINGSTPAEVKVYYPDYEGTLSFSLDDPTIATCEWSEAWENDETTATLIITPVNSGTTNIHLTNTSNDQELNIIVVVE